MTYWQIFKVFVSFGFLSSDISLPIYDKKMKRIAYWLHNISIIIFYILGMFWAYFGLGRLTGPTDWTRIYIVFGWPIINICFSALAAIIVFFSNDNTKHLKR